MRLTLNLVSLSLLCVTERERERERTGSVTTSLQSLHTKREKQTEKSSKGRQKSGIHY